MTEQKWIQKIADTIISVHNYNASPLEIARQIHEHYKQAGYVRLAEDQGLPNKWTYAGNFHGDDYNSGYFVAQKDILKANFRKVEL